MVIVGTIGHGDVEIKLGGGGDGFEELFDQLDGKRADCFTLELHIKDEGRATGEVNGDLGETFVHGDDGPAVSLDAAFVSHGLLERLTEHDANVFNRYLSIVL